MPCRDVQCCRTVTCLWRKGKRKNPATMKDVQVRDQRVSQKHCCIVFSFELKSFLFSCYFSLGFTPSGCVMPFERVTSRTFASVLDVCPQKCEMHKVLLEATARFNAPRRRSLMEGELEILEPTQLKPEKESVGAPQRTLASWRLPRLNLKSNPSSSTWESKPFPLWIANQKMEGCKCFFTLKPIHPAVLYFVDTRYPKRLYTLHFTISLQVSFQQTRRHQHLTAYASQNRHLKRVFFCPPLQLSASLRSFMAVKLLQFNLWHVS